MDVGTVRAAYVIPKVSAICVITITPTVNAIQPFSTPLEVFLGMFTLGRLTTCRRRFEKAFQR